MKPKKTKELRMISAIVLTSIAFVLVCAAGFFTCPKLGLPQTDSETVDSEDYVMPCHAESNEAGNSEERQNGNSCQCNEVSKSDGIRFQIEFSQLVRVFIQKLYLPSPVDLPISIFVYQTVQSNADTFQNDSLVLQKTIKLLI
ncbi:hypothetical protein ND816_17425 [Leptospira levettii]|uniref:hypothetical protein n=1 Tax=Leptospira levettii TaxID=2023178 RepID=UPI00223D2304|nr:hypothetical protein [Leptospira levettii]MCW7509460.1 hypothetical protein [Leptospira levettii]MCW7520716.1 hypothetical protein [Leptospira levettii]